MENVEKKLLLTQFLRQENANNRMRMQTREEILYGIPKPGVTMEEPPYPGQGAYQNSFEAGNAGGVRLRSGFGIRLVLAAVLFAGIVYMDKNQTQLFGKKAAQVISSQLQISQEEKLLDFMNNFPDFLKDGN